MEQALTAPISRTRIKVCGLTRECDVDAAVAAGVDALGFVLYAPSPRAVSLERATELAQRLPPFVTPVLLFVNASDADVLFLALGSPRQEKWMNQHGDKLRVGMCMGVGGTLDTIVGKVKRAPMAWRRAKLEWLYRLIRQPSRFWRQRRIFYFAARVLLEKALHPKISK